LWKSSPTSAWATSTHTARTASTPSGPASFNILGAYSQLPFWLGTENFWTDAVPGSGYLRPGGTGGNYRSRIATQIAADPDVVIVHGGGANDLYLGFTTVPAIVAEAITYFTELRTALPNAKLVFVEGFAPPVGFGTFNDEYIDIRTQLQAALTAVGVYYIDVATSAAWLDGNGYVGATTGTGNSDIYVGGDGIHLTERGAQYVLTRLAQKYRTVLADDGSLINTLI
jgi:lysophospholipase L1-like esterase